MELSNSHKISQEKRDFKISDVLITAWSRVQVLAGPPYSSYPNPILYEKGFGYFFVSQDVLYAESMQNGKQERTKAGYHHGDGALPFALESGSQSDNLILSFPHVVRFGLIAAYVRTWPVRTYAEKRESSDI